MQYNALVQCNALIDSYVIVLQSYETAEVASIRLGGCKTLSLSLEEGFGSLMAEFQRGGSTIGAEAFIILFEGNRVLAEVG